MPDLVGPLRLPADAGAEADPLICALRSFLQASVNADTKGIWARVNPGAAPGTPEPLPISFTFGHDPDEGTVSTKQLPALYVWRHASPRGAQLTQAWRSETSNVAIMWVPPPVKFEHRRAQQTFRNPLSKSLRRNLSRGRNPAWVLEDDPDPKAATRGSLFIRHARAWRYELLDVRPFDFDLPPAVPSEKLPLRFDCVLATLEVVELLRNTYEDVAALRKVETTVRVGEPPLHILSPIFQPTVIGVAPNTGPSAGGTPVVVEGNQLQAGMEIELGGTRADDVEVVNSCKATAITPAHAPGVVDVVVRLPSGATATLANAFTYV